MTVDFKDKPEPGKCSAKRCRQTEGLETFHRPSGDVPLCPRHLAMAREPPPPVDPLGPLPGEVPSQIVPAPPAELQAETADAENSVAGIEALTVETEEDLRFAADLLAEIKGKNNRLEGMKKTATGPLNESLKAIRAWFAPAQNALATMEAVLKDKIAQYHRGLEGRRAAAVAQITASASTGEVTAALAALGAAANPGKVDGLSMREVNDFEIVDPFALPRDCLMPDLEYIRAKVQAGIEIPGVRTFKKTVVASRAS